MLELEQQRTVNQVIVSALSAPGSWIFFPRKVRVLASNDGVNYQLAGQQRMPEQTEDRGSEIDYFTVDFAPIKARYLKVEVLSLLENPVWHPNPGGKCWIFVDEIMVNGPVNGLAES